MLHCYTCLLRDDVLSMQIWSLQRHIMQHRMLQAQHDNA